VRVLRPLQAVGAGRVADGVRLVLLATGVPHPVHLLLLVEEDVRTHDGHLLPRLFGRHHRPVARPLPGLAVFARRVADPGLAPGLAGVPHAVLAAVADDHGAVDVVLPAGRLVRAEHDGGFAPRQAVLALDDGDTLFRTPGEPHPVLAVLSQGR